MGGVYGKIAQILAYDEARTDVYDECECIFQSETVAAFAKLIDTDRAFADAFESVSTEVYKAGSIGQVHRARLRDGTKVVIKMRYVGISEALASDLYILNKFGSLVFSFANLECATDKIEHIIKQELNYELEIENITRIGDFWADDPEIYIPRVYAALCKPNLIVMDDAEALMLRAFTSSATQDEQTRIGRCIVRFLFKTLYCHGLLYTDIHMGNLFVREDGRLVVIDFGSIDVVEQTTLERMKDVHRSLIAGDRRAFFDAVAAVGVLKPDISAASREYMYAYFTRQYEPWTSDHFEFTDEWMDVAMKKEPQLMKEWVLPPALVFWNKIIYGAYHVFHKLRLRGNLKDIIAPFLENACARSE